MDWMLVGSCVLLLVLGLESRGASSARFHDHQIDELLFGTRRPESLETATFAMGCFWAPDAWFGVLPGVVRTRVGYAGGTTAAPSYGNIGDHAEAVQMEFDPEIISYVELLEVFWEHQRERRIGSSSQYRTMILVHDADQQAAALAMIDRLENERGDSLPIPVVPLGTFTRAEERHQKFHLQSRRALRVVFDELLVRYACFGEFVDSTVAARVNGFAAGAAPSGWINAHLAALGLSEDAASALCSAAP
jgi:methionine-S-sulfoxide reductase